MAVDEQPLLRGEAQRAFVPFAIAKHAELFEQLAYQRFALGGHGNIVRGPRILRNFVFAPTRIAAGLRSISSSTKSRKPRLSRCQAAFSPAMPPPTITMGTRSCRAGARNARVIAQAMAQRKRIVDEAAGNLAIRLAPQADQRGAPKNSRRGRALMRDVLPFLFVITNQHLIVQPIRFGRHGLHVHRKNEQLSDIRGRKESQSGGQFRGGS